MVSNELFFALLALLCLFSCKERAETGEVEKIQLDSIKQALMPNQEVRAKGLAKTVKTDSGSNDSINITIEENLFGTFFGDRMEFFVVHDPENLIHGAKIKTVTFCYLDGELCQSKYVLESDISDKLIRAHGSFRIRGFDFRDRSVISGRRVMVNYGTGQELNRDLHNYELTWVLGDRHVKMRVNRRTADQPFEYTEQLADYHLLFKSIEYGNL